MWSEYDRSQHRNVEAASHLILFDFLVCAHFEGIEPYRHTIYDARSKQLHQWNSVETFHLQTPRIAVDARRLPNTMPGLTLASFIFFAFQLTRIATLSAQGLSDTAAPSLVLLGTAKGGTTDVWHMIHRIHKGFCSFDPQTFESFDSQYPEHIQTKKELDFFGDGLDSVCSGVNGAGYKKLFCTPDEMGSLLRCPNVLVNQWVEERKKRPNSANLIAARCKEWLTVHHISTILFINILVCMSVSLLSFVSQSCPGIPPPPPLLSCTLFSLPPGPWVPRLVQLGRQTPLCLSCC